MEEINVTAVELQTVMSQLKAHEDAMTDDEHNAEGCALCGFALRVARDTPTLKEMHKIMDEVLMLINPITILTRAVDAQSYMALSLLMTVGIMIGRNQAYAEILANPLGAKK